MNKSVLKASFSEAIKLWEKLDASKTPSGKDIFKKVDIEGGFEIVAPYQEDGKWARTEEGKLAKKVIFRFQELSGKALVEWDPNAITI